MQFEEMGNRSGKTLMLLPGTARDYQTNFGTVLDRLGVKYHLICVNYDGFVRYAARAMTFRWGAVYRACADAIRPVMMSNKRAPLPCEEALSSLVKENGERDLMAQNGAPASPYTAM